MIKDVCQKQHMQAKAVMMTCSMNAKAGGNLRIKNAGRDYVRYDCCMPIPCIVSRWVHAFSNENK